MTPTGPRMPSRIPAIVLSSHTMGLAVIRSLGQMGVPVISVYYHKQDMGYVSRYVKEAIFAPHPEDEENAFLDILVECRKRFGPCIVIPTDDATLTAVSRNKSMLDHHHIVASTDWSVSEQFIDKAKTYDLARRIGIPAPRMIVPTSAADVEKLEGSIEFPVIVKPRIGHRYFERFRKKMVRVEHFDQLIAAYREASRVGIGVMFLEFIPGGDEHGVNYNSYFWDDRPLVEFTAEKVRLSPPGFGVPSVVISKVIGSVAEPGRKLLRAMGFQGYSCTEFKKDIRDGVYKLMEVNGRHNRTGLLALRCGINFAWLQYQHLVSGEIPSSNSYAAGVYWIDEFRDLAERIRSGRKGNGSLKEYLQPYRRPHIFAVFDPLDIKPFVKRVFDIVRMIFGKIFSIRKQFPKSTRQKEPI